MAMQFSHSLHVDKINKFIHPRARVPANDPHDPTLTRTCLSPISNPPLRRAKSLEHAFDGLGLTVVGGGSRDCPNFRIGGHLPEGFIGEDDCLEGFQRGNEGERTLWFSVDRLGEGHVYTWRKGTTNGQLRASKSLKHIQRLPVPPPSPLFLVKYTALLETTGNVIPTHVTSTSEAMSQVVFGARTCKLVEHQDAPQGLRRSSSPRTHKSSTHGPPPRWPSIKLPEGAEGHEDIHINLVRDEHKATHVGLTIKVTQLTAEISLLQTQLATTNDALSRPTSVRELCS
ncbi:hypothetical protein BDY19DRAFT_988013 [Irpex rosettiformis]|uniref:Uncharacterized protein n=1 Tax=Irpex rosettiformis TaxID=378272 RepID=A0ACB8UJ50_9APHY|nr:hypothetical protein BDY19DRAFT_988013 [Irpex rosettiformis]